MPLLRDKPTLWPDSVVCGQAVHHCCWRHGCVWECDGGGGHRAWSTAHQHDPARAALGGEWKPARAPLPERGAAGHGGESREGACCAAGFCWVWSKPAVWVRIGMQERGRACCCSQHAGSVFLLLMFLHSGGLKCFRAAASTCFRLSCRVYLLHVCFTLFQMQVCSACCMTWCHFPLQRNTVGFVCEIPLLCFYRCFWWVFTRIQSLMQIKVSFYMSTKDGRLKLMQKENLSCHYCSVAPSNEPHSCFNVFFLLV